MHVLLINESSVCLTDYFLTHHGHSFSKMYLSRYCISTKIVLLYHFFLPKQNADHATKPILKSIENLLQTLESVAVSLFNAEG